ncbi:MAG: NUDIX hydrolase [Proteobacteria bacterium]|jgi:ADP-ribose pyrophosphatase|nr:NUDIX hydrolase [Pseudomonadota bacterium]
MEKPKRLAREVIYEDPWVNLYADRVEYPTGRVVDRHHVLEFDKAAIAVVVRNQQDDILMIRSYRYVTDAIELEIPAGGIDPGEDILDAGGREVLEETGFHTRSHRLIYTYHPMNGIANKVFHVATAEAEENVGEFDESEVVDWRWMSKSEVRTRIRKQEIRDGYTLTALLLYLAEVGQD